MRISFFILSILFANSFFAQDSLKLEFDKLGWKDILETNNLEVGKKVLSASRTLKEINDLPFPVYVISKEEIRSNGYITLVDALKSLPGIRVSQPGSALEGETFMMNGLLGNAYTKILINDIPIKPFAVSGMPIGAQLPIQNAERIEVLYGPSAALYGPDASAGVVNIILSDSERPSYTQAALHLGSDEYSNLDLAFGGKIGKNKNVLKFRLYGGYTTLNNRRIFYDEENLYNPSNYLAFLQLDSARYVLNNNYRGTRMNPVLNNTPHESRQLGFDVKYRSFALSVKNMFRKDHSSIGLSPLAVSYFNPLNFTGETISEANLSFQKRFKKWDTKTTIGVLNYTMDNKSSITYVEPFLKSVMLFVAEDITNPANAYEAINTAYFSNSRFRYASSTESYMEQLNNIQVGKYIELTAGIKGQIGYADPLIDFQRIPVNEGKAAANNITYFLPDYSYYQIGAFAQAFFKFKKFNFVAGAQYFKRDNFERFVESGQLNPRLAGLYKVNKKIGIYGSYSTAYRVAPPYYSTTSYEIRSDITDLLRAGVDSLGAEKTFSYQVGLRTNLSPKFKFDINWYYAKTDNFLSRTLAYATNENDDDIFKLGFQNSDLTFAEINGINGSIAFTDIIPSIKFNTRMNFSFSKAIRRSLGIDSEALAIITKDSEGLPAYPNYIVSWRVEANPIAKLRITADTYLAGSSLTRNSIIPDELFESEDLENDGFVTFDIAGNYSISRKFQVYFKFINLFNQKYGGIDANETADILFYNPQSLRIFRLGVNYSID